MLTIINLAELFGEEYQTREVCADTIYTALQDSLDATNMRISVGKVDDAILFGSKDAEKFLNIVERWNQDIRTAAKTAVLAWLNNMPLDDLVSYQARLRISEADNTFNINGSRCVVQVNQFGSPDLHTVLSGPELEDMRKNPQHYVITDMSFDTF